MLSDADLGLIPDHVRPKVAEMQRRVEEAEAGRAAEGAEREQRMFELTERSRDLETKLATIVASRENLQTSLHQTEAERATRATQLTQAQGKLEVIQSDLDNTKRQLLQRDAEKEALERLLETRNESIQSLKEEQKSLRVDLDSVTAEKLKAMIALEEEKSKDARAHFQETRWSEERAALEEELRWTRAAQSEAEERLGRAKSELRAKEMDTASALDALKDQLAEAHRSIQESQQREEDLSLQLHELNDRLRSAHTGSAEARAEFERELEVQKKLTGVYMESSKEAEARVTQLNEALQSITSVFDESKQNLLSMKEELERTRAGAETELKRAREETGAVREDLEKANELLRSKHRVMLTDEVPPCLPTRNGSELAGLEEVAALSPGAAAASKLIRDGRSLTNIYRDHSRIVEELEATRSECHRLEQYIKEIVNDIQEKAPVLRAQKEELQTLRDANKALQEQLIRAGHEHNALSNRADATLRELKYTKAELERYQRDNSDLGTQVRNLVLYVERVRAGSGEETAGEDQFLFRNIDELQAVNQRLMSQLREAETKRDEIIRATQEEQMCKLRGELEGAMSEVTSLRKHREAQENIIQTLSGQREEMKRLYLEAREKSRAKDKEPERDSALGASPSLSAANSSDTQNMVDKKEVESMVARIETELSIFKKEKVEVDKIHEAKIAQLGKRVEELTKTNSKLGADLIYAEERFKVLEKNTEGYKREAERLRDRLSKSETACGKQEQRAMDLTQRLLDMQDNLSKERVTARSSGEALEISRRREAELTARLESIRSQESSHRNLISTIQELQHKLERTEAMRTYNSQEEVEGLRRDKKALRETLATLEEEKKALILSYNNRVGDLQGDLDSHRTKLQVLEKRTAEGEEQLKEAEEKAASLGVELEELRTSGKDASAERFQKENHQLQTRFNYLEVQFREKVLVLEKTAEELGRAKAEIQRYEGMSRTMESNIQREKDTATVLVDQLKEELALLRTSRDQWVVEALERVTASERALTALGHEKEDLQTRLARVETLFQAEKADLEAAVAAKEGEVGEWREKESQARSDRDRLTATVQELQTASDATNAAHALLQTSFEQMKANMETKEAQLRELTQERDQNQNELESLRAAKESVHATIAAEREEMAARVGEVEKVNESLNQQILQLGAVVSSYEKSTGTSEPAEGAETGELSGKSAGALLEALRHLREEKTKAEERESEAVTTAAILRNRQGQLEDQIAKSKAELAKMVSMETQLAEAAADKMKLLTQLNTLKEVAAANDALKQEKTTLQADLASLQKDLAQATENTAAISAEKRRLESEVGRVSREMESVSGDVETWKRRHDQLVNQRAVLESQQLIQLRQEMKDKEAKISELTKLRPALAAKEGELTQAHAAAGKEKERLEGEVADQKSKTIDLGQKLESAEAEAAKAQKTLQQARQLAIKYKKMFQEADEKLKSGAPVAESVSKESLASSNDSRLSELEAAKKELEDKMAGMKQSSEKQQEQHKTELSEFKQRLDLIAESKSKESQKNKELLSAMGNKIAEKEKEKQAMAKELAELRQKVEKTGVVERELEEAKKRLSLITTMQRRQQQTRQAEEGGKSDPREEEAGGVGPVVQPVVPQPSQSSQPPEEALPQPGRFRPSIGIRRPPVASVPPTGGRRQQALVPPSVSPGPTLPDQSSSSSATGPVQASVPPMQMAVSTTGGLPAPVPHAVVTPHHSLAQQEQVSGSSDVVSAGPGSSSGTFRSTFGGSSVGSPQSGRKRGLPGTAGLSPDKRARADSPEQVSTSEPVLPFSQGEGLGVGAGEEEELPGEEEEDEAVDDAPLPTENDSSDDEGVGEPDDIQGMEDVDEDDDVEQEESDDEEPNDVVESTGSDLDEMNHGDDDDDDDEVQIIEENSRGDESFGEAMPAAESSGDVGGDELGGQEGGEDLPLGDGIVPSGPSSFLDNIPNVQSSGGRNVPESSGLFARPAASPPDEGIDSDSGGASSTMGVQPQLPGDEPAGTRAETAETAGSRAAQPEPDSKEVTSNDDEPSTSQEQPRKKVALRKPIVWSEPGGHDGPPDLSVAESSSTSGPSRPARGRGSARKSVRPTHPPTFRKGL